MTTATTAMPPLPASAQPGPQMARLAPFFRNWRWTGRIEEHGMGPGSPAMTGIGLAACRLIEDGLWYDCSFQQEQRLLDGRFVLTWKLHWITGWDGRAAEYRACSADNNGPTLEIYRGRIESDRLIYEPLDQALPRIRLTWILDGPDHARWRNEVTVDGEAWDLIEEYHMEADPEDVNA